MDKEVPALPDGYKVPQVWEMPTSSGGPFASMNQPTAGARSEEELPRGKHDIQLYSLGTPNGMKVRYFELYDFKRDGLSFNILIFKIILSIISSCLRYVLLDCLLYLMYSS